MSSTLIARVNPLPTDEKEWHFGQQLKCVFARRFYDHDGSLGGGRMTLDDQHLDWMEGVRDGWGTDDDQLQRLCEMIEQIKEGRTIDIWFEV